MKKTNAERQAAYRDRLRAKGIKPPSGPGGKNYSRWECAKFIALDGEGESYGKEEKFTLPGHGKHYAARRHRYTFLAASTGENLYNDGQALNSIDCFDFLLNLAVAHPKSIFVIFGGAYDVNHMLLFGFEKHDLQVIAAGRTLRFECAGVTYEIEYRQRKSLTLRRGLSFKKNARGKWVTSWEARVTIWDVFGFFQESFVAVMGKWLGKDWKHYDLISRMKAMRGDFEMVDQGDINAYNKAELETLVAIMDKVHTAISMLDLVCLRWDGAGAIAAAMMRKHTIKEFMGATPPEISDAVRTAYAGGRIEICKAGVHAAPVYDYDINSAYPFIMQQLPCLAHGHWITGTSALPPSGFTMVQVKWKFARDLPFYPLFYRDERMQICFPDTGEGIYWWPEYEAALNCPGQLEVIRWWHWKTACHHKPFSWIEHYYKMRRKWIQSATQEWQKGAEKIIKLGLASLYGKTAQQLGGSNERTPAYHQMEWGGYITSAARARLYSAGCLASDSVIGFATDGIFTTAPLAMDINENKKLGEWDLQIRDGITLAQAGVYWWHDKDRFEHFSRGFDKEAMESPRHVVDAWKAGKSALEIKMHRLIGLGSACANGTFWKMRGRFTDSMRSLQIDGRSHKRGKANIKKGRPHLGLVDLPVNHNIEYDNDLQGLSHPYPLQWARDPDFEKELEEDRENCDTENI